MKNKSHKEAKKYIGKIYNKRYKIVDVVLKKSPYENQNRSYFIMKHLVTQESVERRVGKIIKAIKSKEICVSEEQKLSEEFKRRLVDIIFKRTQPLKLEVERLTSELLKSQEIVSKLSNKLKSIESEKSEIVVTNLRTTDMVEFKKKRSFLKYFKDMLSR